MKAFVSLSKAMLKGYVRDREAVFFTIFFPLMFLVLFGGLLANQDQSKIDVIAVGEVGLIDDMPAPAQPAFDEAFSVKASEDLESSLSVLRKGDATLVIEQTGDEIVVHFSGADQVQAAVAQGTFQSFVQSANVAASGEPATYQVSPQRVEDQSLSTIQFVTPGLLGWAIATSATFGAAVTLVGWRSTKLLRRIRLAPVPTISVVGARVGVTLLIALGQMVIFIGLAMAGFGLELTGS